MQHYAKKSLGQNFLQDANIIRKIILAIDPQPEDRILEIGPGQGALTHALMDSGCRLSCVELDDAFAEQWTQHFADSPHLQLIHDDILKVDLSAFFPLNKLVGNIPYNISAPLLTKVLKQHHHIKEVIFMVQREFAEKCTAKPKSGSYGIISVLSQLFSCPEILFNVAPTAFFPSPAVTSSIIRFSMNDDSCDTEKAFRLVSTAFQQRRKKLKNSLKAYYSPELEDRIPWEKRADQLSIDEFRQLIEEL